MNRPQGEYDGVSIADAAVTKRELNPRASYAKERVFLIGPGGVGKTTVGPLIAAKLSRPFLDLDEQFCERVGPIRRFLDENGYPSYVRQNAALFRQLLGEAEAGTVFALSSGFLATDVEQRIIEQNRALVMQQGTALLLIPSDDPAECARIIVERQLRRGFGLEQNSQLDLIRDRLPAYLKLGHVMVASSSSPDSIAKEAVHRLEAFWS